ncbi:response regulator [Pseudofrankia inefficax]|uniref:Two component transcriptional regulator, LuxR family n=1 Tax=Pseudofrankia inefficax (strain DSM 45817 / CECT 9037 / DDB 130130 / EuI1c) TaxID=298654 RepID=E3IXC8_PSEI1|nr:response regulator transcription factor [Pseudofrankia inefficax]ADP85028.1 two component transcriptional regulator, LuxR family [Pseudofrankia inefficax]
MRVVIAEGEALLRELLARLFTASGLEVVGTAADASRLLEVVAEALPDVVVTDIPMPPGHTDDGLRAALAIRARHPAVGVVVLSRQLLPRYATALVGDRPAGVGYLLKQQITDVDRLCADVRRVADGGIALDPEVVELMVGRAEAPRSPLGALTARQREVLALIAQGRSNGAIAAKLGVSAKAVVQHVSRIYDALGLPPDPDHHRRVLAAVRFLAG